MAKKRILILVSEYPQVSETYIETERRALEDRYDLSLVTLNHSDQPYSEHGPYRYVHKKDGRALASAVRDFSPDVIHGHYLFMTPTLMKIARVAKVPFTVRAHSFDVLSEGIDLGRYAKFINDDSCLGLLTFPFTRPLLERAGVREEKIHECHPVVDVGRFYDESPNGDAVMNVGACIPKKNMEEFLMLGTRFKNRVFNLYAIGYQVEKIRKLNLELGSPVNIVEPLEPSEMPRQYKKHEWIVYTGSHRLATVGWPMAVAEAQAAGVGVCVQRVRRDLEEYVGRGGFLFETIDEAEKIISQPFPDEMRRLGFEQAKKSDIYNHIRKLEDLWKPVLEEGFQPALARRGIRKYLPFGGENGI